MIDLTSDLTLYIRSDGNDANDGSANDSAHAFATLQHAYDYAANTYILCGAKITFKLGIGFFSGLATSRAILGAGKMTDIHILGSGSGTYLTQAVGSVGSIALGDGDAGQALMYVSDLTIYNPLGYGIICFFSKIVYANIYFDQCAYDQVNAAHCSWIRQIGPCTVVGSATNHLSSNTNAVIATHGSALTFPSSVSFSGAYATANGGSCVYGWPMTYTGASNVVGRKFNISPGSIIDMGGNVNNLAGNSAGVNTGGWAL